MTVWRSRINQHHDIVDEGIHELSVDRILVFLYHPASRGQHMFERPPLGFPWLPEEKKEDGEAPTTTAQIKLARFSSITNTHNQSNRPTDQATTISRETIIIRHMGNRLLSCNVTKVFPCIGNGGYSEAPRCHHKASSLRVRVRMYICACMCVCERV